MGGKRKKSESEGGKESEANEQSNHKHKKETKEKKEKKEILPSTIKNKEKRSAVYAKLKHEKKLEKRKKAKDRDAAEKRALELGDEVQIL